MLSHYSFGVAQFNSSGWWDQYNVDLARTLAVAGTWQPHLGLCIPCTPICNFFSTAFVKFFNVYFSDLPNCISQISRKPRGCISSSTPYLACNFFNLEIHQKHLIELVCCVALHVCACNEIFSFMPTKLCMNIQSYGKHYFRRREKINNRARFGSSKIWLNSSINSPFPD